MAIDLALLTFAFSTGVLTFFSPCSVALIPAYVGYYAGLDADGDATPLEAAWAGTRSGAAAAGGVLALFALGGLAIYVLRTQLELVGSGALADALQGASLAVGLLLIGLGVAMVASARQGIGLPIRAPRRRTPGSAAAFGVLFAVASMGCTLPLVFGVLGSALAQGPAGALATVLAFGAGLAVLLLAVGVAVSVAEERVQAQIGRIVPHVRTAGGVLLVLAGLYILGFYAGLAPDLRFFR